MQNNRLVFFLGAGATQQWGNLTTSKINECFKNINLFTTKDGNILGSYLFEILEKYYHPNPVNFETFIALLETLTNYQYQSNLNSPSPIDKSLTPLLFNLSDVANSIINSYMNYNSKEILIQYMSVIITLINKQEFFFQENNTSLLNLYNKLKEKSIIRTYTINYDNLLPILFADKRNVFNGFTDENYEIKNRKINKVFKIDSNKIIKIINDRDCLNYYNLHGSVHWSCDVWDLALGISDFAFYPYQTFPLPDYTPNISINPNDSIPLLNIVAGYNKSQRVLIPPLNYFMSSFIQDCVNADKIVIVGYSWNDIHLNRIIKSGNNSEKCKFIIIDKTLPDANIEEYKNQFRKKIENEINDICFNDKIENGWMTTKGFKYSVYINGFEEFLKKEDNWQYLLD